MKHLIELDSKIFNSNHINSLDAVLGTIQQERSFSVNV